MTKVFRVGHFAVSLGIIIAADRYLKQALVAAAIMFQSALFGMYCRFTVLVAVDVTVPAAATAVGEVHHVVNPNPLTEGCLTQMLRSIVPSSMVIEGSRHIVRAAKRVPVDPEIMTEARKFMCPKCKQNICAVLERSLLRNCQE
ncbi:hypothetical protein Tco_1491238 [Tanacetum coccineum]